MTAAGLIAFRCVRLVQPIGEFYVGAISSADLVEISYADIRRIVEGKPRDIEEFSGIQRPLSQARVKEIQQYVTTVDAAFPTSIILHVESKDAEFDESSSTMRIRRDENVAKIIDGQHRIEGLRGFRSRQFELSATFFVDMDMEDQALLFATINLKQTKVNKSLAYDLFEFATARSPQKTTHNIARLLNTREGSPFYHRIKVLGSATRGRDETITQATFVDRLIVYISDNPMRDRDALKRGNRLPRGEVRQGRPLMFRDLFIAEKDAEIAKVIWNYFIAVQKRWPKAWNDVTRGLILNRTTGFGALMRFLANVYPRVSDPSGVVGTEVFDKVFSSVDLQDGDFTRERYLPGTSGESQLLRDLVELSGYK